MAAEQVLRLKGEDGESQFERVFRFADLQNPQALLREIGYRGPIGLMCYGIQGDAREHLERSLKVWNGWEAAWAKK